MISVHTAASICPGPSSTPCCVGPAVCVARTAFLDAEAEGATPGLAKQEGAWGPEDFTESILRLQPVLKSERNDSVFYGVSDTSPYREGPEI